MFIYNVTVNVEESVCEDWILWMKKTHIPDVMSTGCFVSHRICRVLNVDDEGRTYSVQYFFNTMDDLERYQQQHAPRLQNEHRERYGDRALAFRTLLQLED